MYRVPKPRNPYIASISAVHALKISCLYRVYFFILFPRIRFFRHSSLFWYTNIKSVRVPEHCHESSSRTAATLLYDSRAFQPHHQLIEHKTPAKIALKPKTNFHHSQHLKRLKSPPRPLTEHSRNFLALGSTLEDFYGYQKTAPVRSAALLNLLSTRSDRMCS